MTNIGALPLTRTNERDGEMAKGVKAKGKLSITARGSNQGEEEATRIGKVRLASKPIAFFTSDKMRSDANNKAEDVMHRDGSIPFVGSRAETWPHPDKGVCGLPQELLPFCPRHWAHYPDRHQFLVIDCSYH